MDNLNEVMNAFARVMDKPRNPLYAMQEFMEKLDKHGRDALREWEEVQNTQHAIEDGRLVYLTEEVRKTA